MKPYKRHLKNPSRKLRKNMTEAEQAFWYRVRRKQILGLAFNRQKPILDYIVDFYCAKARLVIELDGSQHYDNMYQHKDNVRDRALSKTGLLVLRYNNHQVLTDTDHVIEHLYNVVESRLLP